MRVSENINCKISNHSRDTSCNKNPPNNATDTLVAKMNRSLIQYNLFLTDAHLTSLIYLYSIEKQLFKNVREVTCAFLKVLISVRYYLRDIEPKLHNRWTEMEN